MYRMSMLFVLALPGLGQTWVNGTGQVPALAVRGGTDVGGAALYICRATDGQGVTHVGKFRTGLGCLYFYNGQPVVAGSYQVLTDDSVSWQAAAGGSVPAGSYQAASGLVYICRAWVEDSLQVGQLRGGSTGCAIEFGATGGVFTSYEVLRRPWAGASNGAIPSGAVATGADSGGTLYTCRAVSGGAMQIGKLRSDFTGCRIGLSGSITVATSYEVLVNMTPQWQSFTGAIPAGGAFFAGSASGQPKYICRFTIGGTSDLTPGQVGGPAGEQPNSCKVEYFGSSKDSGAYQALVNPEPASSCNYTVSPQTVNAGAGGGTATITMTSGCGWVNFPSDSWIQPSVRSGSGSGTFTLTVSPNPSTSPRTGTVSAGGKTITVNQAGACVYTVSPLTVSFSASGGTRSVSVTTTPGCNSWSAVTPSSWLTIGGGSSFVTITAIANLGAARSAQVYVAGQTVTVTQEGVCPAYTVSPSTLPAIPAAGGSYTFTPTSSTSCMAVVTGPPWGTITPAQPVGAFTLTVQANSTYAARMGSISVGGSQTIDLQQAGQSCNVVAAPLTTQLPAAGGAFSIQVSVANPACQWSVSNNTVNFASFGAGALSGQGNGTITGTATPTTQARSGTMQINSYQSSQTVTVNQAAVCTYSASPTSLNLTSAAQTVSVNITTQPGCPVSFNFGAPWMSYSGTGSGPGAYTLNVQENTTYASRPQIFTVGSATLSATQTGRPCTPQVAQPPTVASGGGQFQFSIQVPDSGCEWTATTTSPFLTLQTASARGNGTVTGTATANSGVSARSGTVTVSSYLASASAMVNQAGLTCSYTLTPQNSSIGAAGGSRTFTVGTSQGCSWTAVTPDPAWLSFGGTASGNGPGQFTVTVAANATAHPRTGSVSAGGISATVTQEASACTYTLSSTGISVAAAGRPDTVNVTANAGCAWSASSPESWVQITAGASGSGNGQVAFTVLSNPSSGSRTSVLAIAGRNFTVTQAGTAAGPPAQGLTFVSLAPCRILETRQDYNFEGRTGVFGPPFLARGEVRTLPMQNSSLCPIPPSAKAYVVNVTMVPRGSVDFVTLWPSGEARPNVWSIRSPDGNTVANSAIVKAGSNGAIQVYASDATDLLIDVAGYFTDNTAVSNLVYYPLAPCRVIDTRLDYRQPGPFGPPSMLTRETRRFRFPSSACRVPEGAAAYSMTITVVPQGTLQFLTAWPAGGVQPNVSSINSPAGRVLANSVILPASADGSIDVFAFNQTDFIIDINGYFAPDDGVNGQYYFPVTQCRASDSTASGGIYADDTARTIAVPSAAGCAGIPAAARGYAMNVTAMPGGSPMPFVSAYPAGQSRPNASILNAFEGQIVTNSAIVPAGIGGAVDIYAYRRTHLVVEISGYFGR